MRPLGFQKGEIPVSSMSWISSLKHCARWENPKSHDEFQRAGNESLRVIHYLYSLNIFRLLSLIWAREVNSSVGWDCYSLKGLVLILLCWKKDLPCHEDTHSFKCIPCRKDTKWKIIRKSFIYIKYLHKKFQMNCIHNLQLLNRWLMTLIVRYKVSGFPYENGCELKKVIFPLPKSF